MGNSKSRNLKFAKITDNATIPVRNSKMSAGVDLSSAYDYIVPSLGKKLVKTDLQVLLPKNTYGRIAPRSGLAMKFIDIGAGVVDQDYRGDIGVIVFNFGQEDFEIKKGMRVAQLIIEQIMILPVKEVNKINVNTGRGAKGFGSSG